MKELNILDKKILNLLQETNACTPKISYIAKKLEKANTTIYDRVKKLEKNGLIIGYSGEIDPIRAGLDFTAFMLFSVKLGENVESVASYLSKVEGVQEVHFLSGEWDLLVKFKCKNSTEYYKISSTKLMKAPGLLRAKGMIAPRTYKEECRVLLDLKEHSKKDEFDKHGNVYREFD